MDANALQMMILPIVGGVGLGAALGMVGLALMKTIQAIAGPVPVRGPAACLDATGRGR